MNVSFQLAGTNDGITFRRIFGELFDGKGEIYPNTLGCDKENRYHVGFHSMSGKRITEEMIKEVCDAFKLAYVAKENQDMVDLILGEEEQEVAPILLGWQFEESIS